MSTAVLEPVEENKAEDLELRLEKSSGAEGPTPDVILVQMMISSLGAQAIYVAAKLGIADLLANGPKSVSQLAGETETHAPSLYRILRALAGVGIFTEHENKTFKLNQSAELLRSGVDGSLREAAIFMGEDWHWQVWGKTLYSVRTGKSAWQEVHGMEVFPYFQANKDAAKIFDDAMSSYSTVAIKSVVESYDFSGIHTLVDIAGGHGRLLTGILEANPSLKGVLFDQPQVIEGAKEKIRVSEVSNRMELQSGDFFVSVPREGDAYIMKHIIHDWDDDRALSILENIKRAMNRGGRLLLVETVITNDSSSNLGKLLDIEMLVSPGGKERTAEEYEELLARAGFKLTRIVPTKSPYSVIEAVAN